MEQYFIIGGDGKQYGPISEDDVRKWITEGRLNASSGAKAESDAEWRTLDTFPEFAEALNLQTPAGGPTPMPPDSGDWLERDYELDMIGCITKGWEVQKGNFGSLFVSFLIWLALIIGFYVVMSVFGVAFGSKKMDPAGAGQQGFRLLISAISAFLVGPMSGGLNYQFIQAVRGQTVKVGDVFIGFTKSFKDLALGQLAITFLIGLCMLPFNYVITAKTAPLAEQLQQAQQHADAAQMQTIMLQYWKAAASSLPILLICLIPVTYLTVNWQFTLPLIVDKQLKFWPAMKASWKKVHRHWMHIFGLTILIGLLNVAGFLACCVGLFFTFPVSVAAMMIAYETIFGRQKTD
jgi:uncharacterized membrane protein